MHIARGRAKGQPSELRTKTFTGTVFGDPVVDLPEVTIGNVFFGPASRTYWHSHSAGQILNVVAGRGLVANRDHEAYFIEASDVAHANGGEEHWHGGTPDSYVLHTAISLGTTTWLEEVSESDYQAGFHKAQETES